MYTTPAAKATSELGADFVKTFYTGSRFSEVIEATPIPVIVMGADKVDESKALQMAEAGIAAGARGVVFGRDVFECDEPQAFLNALSGVVRQGKAAAAAREFGFAA